MTMSTRIKIMAWIAVFSTPLLFSTNVVFGKSIVASVPPFTLAFIRWGSVALILTPVMLKAWPKVINFVKQNGTRWTLLGFFGMFMCGGVFYLALSFTTAINGALIYATTPVWAILIQFIWFKRPISLKEILGVSLAFLGVSYILMEGELVRLLGLQFNIGDLLALACAIAWALYAIFQKHKSVDQMPTFVMLGLIAASGAILLLPMAIYEAMFFNALQIPSHSWINIAGLVFFSSLLAFGGVKYSIKHLGPTVNVLSLYLLPIYGSLLAVIILGETLNFFHIIGTICVLGGVFIAGRTASQA